MNPFIKFYLDDLKKQQLYRERSYTIHAGLVNFSSNDYLSLRTNPALQAAFKEGFNRYPSGSGSSRTLCGFHDSHHQLEQAFAKKLNVEAGLLFNSGYAANLGVIMLLAKTGFNVLVDKGVHASIYDGIKLAGIDYQRYVHNNCDDLSRKLIKEKTVVVTESIFSMSGQQANLNLISAICNNASAHLIVDEAHAFGVIGKEGLGAVHDCGLSEDIVPLRIIGFGKAMGCQGAIVVGKREWIDALYQSARSHIYSTAMSPAIAYGLLEGLKLVTEAVPERIKLTQLIYYFQQRVQSSLLNWRQSSTAIQQLKLSSPEKALHYAETLKAQGILCMAVREPTVSHQDTGLRVVLNAHHEPEDINNLFDHLHEIDGH